MGFHAAAVVARLAGPGGSAGAGFLIAPDLVISCAHVVNLALGRQAACAEAPKSPITIDLPFARLAGIQARVVEWRPMAPYRQRGAGELHDVAVLALSAPVTGIPPARLATGGGALRCFGFPPHAGAAGEIAELALVDQDAGG